jgi:hypothetical protein
MRGMDAEPKATGKYLCRFVEQVSNHGVSQLLTAWISIQKNATAIDRINGERNPWQR